MNARWTHAVLAIALVFAGVFGLHGHRVERRNDAFQADASMRAASASKRAKSSNIVERYTTDRVHLFTPPSAPAVVEPIRRVATASTPLPQTPRADMPLFSARARAPPI